MVKLILGKKGSGKTKLLIDAIRAAKDESKGNVVTIQTKRSLNAEVRHDVRLIDIEDYNIKDCDGMHGFVAGIMASDYDCTHVFIDGILRIVGEDDRRDLDKVAKMLEAIDKISGGSTVVTLTFSADSGELPDDIKKYA
jgi:Ni2+-binding GTPase involved in maturation of urease and hydrogenase